MPTPEVTPIPGLCISQSNLTTFINNLNLSFDLMVQTINEELGASLTLPGIPPIPLAGMPSITIPKFEALDINQRFAKQPGLRGYVGNVFPVSQGGKGLGGKYTLPGYPGFNVEGFQGQIPGIDPSTYIINLLNQNYQILVQQLAEEGVTVEVTTIPQLDLCGPDNTQGGQQPGGSGTSPGASTVVNIINQNNQNILNGLPAGCVNTLSTKFPPFDGGAYFENTTSAATIILNPNTIFIDWDHPTDSQQGVVTGYDLSAVNPYIGTFPQLAACGNGARLEYDYTLGVIVGSNGASTMITRLIKITQGGTLSIIDSNIHILPGPGPASVSGSDTLTMSAGTVTDTDRLALFVLGVGSGIAPIDGLAEFTFTDLVDLGP